MNTETSASNEPLVEQLDSIEQQLATAIDTTEVPTQGGGYGYAIDGEQPTMYSKGVATSSSSAPDPLPSQSSPAASTGSVPLPKRPKGRLLATVVTLAILAFSGHSIWNSFMRFDAYGSVVARTVEVAPPWGGIVKSLHVREGDFVRHGQLIVTTENLELNHRLERLGDELKLGQANLQAEVADWKLRNELRNDDKNEARADFYDMWGELLRERSRLDELQAKLRRAQKLLDTVAMSEEEYDAIRFAEQGQREKVDKMKSAVVEMHKRVEWEEGNTDDSTPDALKPQLTRLQSLQDELQRMRAQVEQGSIYAPANGRILRIHRYPGEYAGTAQPILDLAVEGTTEVVIFLPQRATNSLQVGETFTVNVEPLAEEVKCRVIRIGERLERAPLQLERYYNENVHLLPVFASPVQQVDRNTNLRLGAEVRLPKAGLWEVVTSPFVDDKREPSTATISTKDDDDTQDPPPRRRAS